jgi:lipoate-protein ligase B
MDHRTTDWGRTRYDDAWKQQLELVAQRKAGSIPDTLVLTEHEPVYTIGARREAAGHLLWAAPRLSEEGIEVVKTNRGGDITYHGPGQIVGYPILDLGTRRDLHGYLRDLEEVLIRTVAHFGLEGRRREGKTGIWIEDRKIAAIGVAVKSWISYHGFALNVEPNLDHFQGIIPCGITDGAVTSLSRECAHPPLFGQVKSRLILEFWSLFGNGA